MNKICDVDLGTLPLITVTKFVDMYKSRCLVTKSWLGFANFVNLPIITFAIFLE